MNCFASTRMGRALVIQLGCCFGLWASLFALPARADGLADNIPDKVRRVPPPGIELTAAQQTHLRTRLAELDAALKPLADRPQALDVQIIRRAVWSALEYQEFFDASDLKTADTLLDVAQARLASLAKREAPWETDLKLTALGYRSRIDGSVQPYGLVVPEGYDPAAGRSHRLDIWFHGRGETLSELRFIQQRMNNAGEFAPADTFVLHPYGRYCNAFKLAGEVDVLEALADVQRRYRIDPDRISVRGFSMGGAGCWQFAVLYSDRWFAANPGAGFSETPEFLRHFQKETLNPTWYERKLWHMYDCPDSAINLFHCPTIAYSGEIDIQKQAADIMEQALKAEGINLLHLIGPATGHQIHADSKTEIERRMNDLARLGRERSPREVLFQTWTLKYNRMHWLTIDELGQHWEQSRVEAAIGDKGQLRLQTKNIRGLSIDMPAGAYPLSSLHKPMLQIDGTELGPLPVKSDRSLHCRLSKQDDGWKMDAPQSDGLRKRHNLQGPIDDAFMDSFIFVRPTGTAASAQFGKWVEGELDHAITHWRAQFRGEARVKDDTAISDEDIASANLVLFGDPQSNAVLKRLADKLPIRWTEKEIIAGERRFDAAQHALLLIYPNPLNSQRYVVLNSGFTFREYDYLNNARQVPKLPDWAIIDLRTAPTSQRPGAIADADFFDERWQLQPPASKRQLGE